MVAALGLEQELLAELASQKMRVGAGADHQPVERVPPAGLQLQSGCLAAAALDGEDIIGNDATAVADDIRGNGLDHAFRIGDEVPSAVEGGAVNGGPQGRFQFARLVAGDGLHLEAEGFLRFAFCGFGLELLLVVIDPQRVLVADEVGRTLLLQ